MGNKIKSIEAQVIFKAMDIINGNACHFITFEESTTKERVYLQVGIGNYMMIIEGDRGVLHYKEEKRRYKSKFKSFERTIYGIKQEVPLIEKNNQNEIVNLDVVKVVALEAEKESVLEKNSEDKVVNLGEKEVLADSKNKKSEKK
jgi:hypothetical protein